MIQAIVVDASVAVQWLLPESTTPDALLVLQRVSTLASPDLIYAEVANAVWKRVQRGEITALLGELLISEFLRIPLEVHPSQELLGKAWRWATSINITVYDALYIALAESLNLPLVTADTRLLSQVEGNSGVQVFSLSAVASFLTS